MNEIETKRDKIELAVLSRLQRERRQRAAVEILRPLIERAKVPAGLKRTTLAKAPTGVSRDEIGALGGLEDVAAVLEKLTGNKMIRLNATGKFEANTVPPDLTQKEEAKFAAKLLADWPEAERERIVAVFTEGDHEDEDD